MKNYINLATSHSWNFWDRKVFITLYVKYFAISVPYIIIKYKLSQICAIFKIWNIVDTRIDNFYIIVNLVDIFYFQTEKDTRSDSSDETLSSTDESINANTPSKKQKSNKATTGNGVQYHEEHHLQNNHEKIQWYLYERI